MNLVKNVYSQGFQKPHYTRYNIVTTNYLPAIMYSQPIFSKKSLSYFTITFTVSCSPAAFSALMI